MIMNTEEDRNHDGQARNIGNIIRQAYTAHLTEDELASHYESTHGMAPKSGMASRKDDQQGKQRRTAMHLSRTELHLSRCAICSLRLARLKEDLEAYEAFLTEIDEIPADEPEKGMLETLNDMLEILKEKFVGALQGVKDALPPLGPPVAILMGVRPAALVSSSQGAVKTGETQILLEGEQDGIRYRMQRSNFRDWLILSQDTGDEGKTFWVGLGDPKTGRINGGQNAYCVTMQQTVNGFTGIIDLHFAPEDEATLYLLLLEKGSKIS